jgi:hypothetical protein
LLKARLKALYLLLEEFVGSLVSHMRNIKVIAIGWLEVVFPDIVEAVHGIAGVRDNSSGEEIEFTAQREVETTAYIWADNAFEILTCLLDRFSHLALDTVGHYVECCENLYWGVRTKIAYYPLAFF